MTTVAGSAQTYPIKPLSGLQAPIGFPIGVALDQQGNTYISDYVNGLVMKLDSSGIVTIVAGNQFIGFSGDGGAATSASISQTGIAVNSAGDLFIADFYNNRIRKVTKDGIISTVAGNGSMGFSGDGGPATSATLDSPMNVALDSVGNLFIIDSGNQRLRRVTTDGVITTVAGNGSKGFSGDGGPAIQASLDLSESNFPAVQGAGIVVDGVGDVFFTDTYNNRIRKVTPDGTITTVAGSGRQGFAGDGGPATSAAFNLPRGLALDAKGNLVIADTYSRRIRKVNVEGTIVTVAGDGSTTTLNNPFGVAVDEKGNIFIADSLNGRIRLVTPDGNITTIVGTESSFVGDGQAATAASLNSPEDAVVDGAGNLFIADTYNNRIRKVTTDGTITTVAGNGHFGPSGDGGPATSASFFLPVGVAIDSPGNLFIIEKSYRVRKVSLDGIITTVAGNGRSVFSGDGGPAVDASFAVGPNSGIAIDANGDLFISDFTNRIRKVTPDGIINTVAGTGTATFSGDGGKATDASLNAPSGLAVDPAGNLLIADTGNNRIRKITPDGIIVTVAGDGSAQFSGDGGPAINASLNQPAGVAVDVAGNVFIADTYNSRIRRVTPDGIITTVAGFGQENPLNCFPFTDGGPATSTPLCGPASVALDASGNLFIADQGYNRVRAVLASPPALSASPQTLSFLGQSAGARPPSQVITVASPVPGVPFDVSVSTSAAGSWLFADVAKGNAPRLIEITADPFLLAPGEYSGAVLIQSPLTAPNLIRIAVSLTVGASAPPSLSLDRTNISFTFPRGSLPRTETIQVSNAGGGSLDFTATASTDAGGNWLKISPQSSTATPQSGVALSITGDPTALSAGTYTGKVVIAGASNANQVTIPVTMTISTKTSALLLSQTGLSFTAVKGGGVVPPQNFGVLNLGTAPLTFSVETSTLAGGAWLAANQKTSGSVDVLVDPSRLTAGRYYGLVQIGSPGAANSPQVLTSHLDVLPRGTDLGGVLQPNELTYNSDPGSWPGSQTFMVYNLTDAPKTFRAVSPDVWVGIKPDSATVTPNEPVQLIVQPFTDILEVGTHQSTIALEFDDGRVRTIRVTVVVVPPAAGAAGAVSRKGERLAETACQATQLLPAITSLGRDFSVPAGWPVALQVQVQDDCGAPLETGSVIAEFSNGDPPLSLTALKGGRWDGTWVSKRTQNGVTVTVKATTADGLRKGVKQVSGGFGAATLPPVIANNGVTDAASGVASRPLSPGSLITIAGDLLADQNATSPSVPFPTTLANSSVILAGQLLPLARTDPGQIVAILPYGIETNTRHQILISRGNTYSEPVSIDLADASPAVFTEGGIQGSIFDAKGNLVSPDNPARPGDVVSIYSTGLGAIQPQVRAGDYGPPSSSTVNPVAVSIGGQSAMVTFSGLAPGLVGIYVVQAIVPDGVNSGDQVPVIITSQTNPPSVSPSVTIAVQR